MRLLLLMTMFIIASSANAGLYKWVDDEGNVHYSQKRPLDKQYKQIKAPPPAPAPQLKPKTIKDYTAHKESDVIEKESEKNAAQREKNCELSKKNLQIYQVYGRIKRDDGSITDITEAEKAKGIATAEAGIKQFCK
ncbi:MAG: DUF4124 domain-containing protein [Gammaproteobacteria bacterium]|nr:DUF4124 domain-containing protein [Gammaproteobacteria bacterium]